MLTNDGTPVAIVAASSERHTTQFCDERPNGLGRCRGAGWLPTAGPAALGSSERSSTIGGGNQARPPTQSLRSHSGVPADASHLARGNAGCRPPTSRGTAAAPAHRNSQLPHWRRHRRVQLDRQGRDQARWHDLRCAGRRPGDSVVQARRPKRAHRSARRWSWRVPATSRDWAAG